jgi:hypothetical protein
MVLHRGFQSTQIQIPLVTLNKIILVYKHCTTTLQVIKTLLEFYTEPNSSIQNRLVG